MSSNIFYKALAAVSTVGIVVIAGIQVKTALKKGNTTEDQLAKTMVEIKNARKEALAEVKSFRSEVLNELNTIRSNSLNDLKNDRANALAEVRTAKKDALDYLNKIVSKSGSGQIAPAWMVIKYGTATGDVLEKVPFPDLATCEMQGALWTSSKKIYRTSKKGFVCLEGE